jgi:hypothetical protein
MHQRYFFPADVLSIAYGFYYPNYFFVPLTINMVSFFSYQYFLFGIEPISTFNLALATLTMIAIVVSKILHELYSPKNELSDPVINR